MGPRRKLWATLAIWLVLWAVVCVGLYLSTDSWSNFPHWQTETWIGWFALAVTTINVRATWGRL